MLHNLTPKNNIKGWERVLWRLGDSLKVSEILRSVLIPYTEDNRLRMADFR